jgi:hypothetical protein
VPLQDNFGADNQVCGGGSNYPGAALLLQRSYELMMQVDILNALVKAVS